MVKRTLPAAIESPHFNDEDQSCHSVFITLTDTFNWTHNLVEEEAPGYLPLGTLVVFLKSCQKH